MSPSMSKEALIREANAILRHFSEPMRELLKLGVDGPREARFAAAFLEADHAHKLIDDELQAFNTDEDDDEEGRTVEKLRKLLGEATQIIQDHIVGVDVERFLDEAA